MGKSIEQIETAKKFEGLEPIAASESVEVFEATEPTESFAKNTAASSNPLSQKQTPVALIMFALPSVLTMVFMGLYTIVDVLFVARFVSSDAMAAINIATPVINLIVGFATMLAAGGNAVIATKMGEGKERESRRDFTLIVLFGCLMSGLVALGGTIFLPSLVQGLGASAVLAPYCSDYLGIIIAFTPASVLQVTFQNAVIAAGRPGVGTAMAVLCGVANIAFDYLFLAVMDLGISGAAWGTVTGYTLAACLGLAFFATRKQGLRFAKPSANFRVIVKSCTNGVSEMVSQAAAAVTTFLFNMTMLSLAGENGVAAVTVMIYTQFLVTSVFIGFSMGVAPVVSFDHGSGNTPALARAFRSCLGCIAVASVGAWIFALLLAPVLAGLFAQPPSPVFVLASTGLAIFSANFLFAGVNIFASAAFTALSNGKLSAIISFLRTFGLVPCAILLLSQWLGVDGVWLAVPLAEGLTCIVSVTLLYGNRKRYGYGLSKQEMKKYEG